MSDKQQKTIKQKINNGISKVKEWMSYMPESLKKNKLFEMFGKGLDKAEIATSDNPAETYGNQVKDSFYSTVIDGATNLAKSTTKYLAKAVTFIGKSNFISLVLSPSSLHDPDPRKQDSEIKQKKLEVMQQAKLQAEQQGDTNTPDSTSQAHEMASLQQQLLAEKTRLAGQADSSSDSSSGLSISSSSGSSSIMLAVNDNYIKQHLLIV